MSTRMLLSSTRRRAAGAIALSMSTIALAYAAAFLPHGAPPWAAPVMALGTTIAFVAFLALGAARPRRGIGRLAWAFWFIAALLLGAFALAFALPASEGPGSPLWLGLPPRAAVILYGIGVVPLFVLPIAYALTFDSATLADDDLRSLRETAGTVASERANQSSDSSS